MSIAAFASLLLTAGGFSMSDGKAVDAFVTQIYVPYRAGDGARLMAWWDRAIYTAPTRQLIAAWDARNHGREDDVSRKDRLCDCKAWDSNDFQVTVVTRTFTGPGRAVVLAHVSPKARHSSDIRLSLVREGGLWRLDDVGDAASGRSLKVALQR